MKSFLNISRLLKTLLVGLFVQSAAVADEQTNSSNSIVKVIENYQAALNASDVDKVMSLYSKQPTFMPQHAPAQIGREAVSHAYENVFQSIELDVELALLRSCE